MNPNSDDNPMPSSPPQWGHRGEPWVILQGVLVVGLIVLPQFPVISWNSSLAFVQLLCDAMAVVLGVTALILMIKGVIDLGDNLTPFPYPKAEGTLVKTGIYRLIRHPLYSGLITAALGWAIFRLSLSHFLGTLLLFAVLDLKAKQEEQWLKQKYPEYMEYCSQVKKFIPGIY